MFVCMYVNMYLCMYVCTEDHQDVHKHKDIDGGLKMSMIHYWSCLIGDIYKDDV